VLLPGLPATSRCLVELVSFPETTGLLASSGKTTGFAMLRVWLVTLKHAYKGVLLVPCGLL
jgi:hypothetical protein